MNRIMIVGQPGSGKSTLARHIGALTGLPVVHIDHIHWQAGWVERPKEEKTRLCAEVHQRDKWVFEGGHSMTWPERMQRCDTLIWLDLPVHLRLRRVFFRSLRYWGKSRPDLPEGCPEQFDWSFYRWIWDTRRSGRVQIDRLIASAPAGKSVYHLTSRLEVKAFLRSLRPSRVLAHDE